MLAVRDDRRGRSKSPGGGEASGSAGHRTLSIDTRTRSPTREERKKSGKQYLGPEDDDRRRPSRDRRVDKKHHGPEEAERRSRRSSKKHGASAKERESGSESEGEGKSSARRQKVESTKYHYPDPNEEAESPRLERGTPGRQDQDGYEPDRRKSKTRKSKEAYGSDSEDESAKWSTPPPAPTNDYGNKREMDAAKQCPEYTYPQPSHPVYSPAESRQVPGYSSPREERRREHSAADPSSHPYSPADNYALVPHMAAPEDWDSKPVSSATGETYMQPSQYQYAQLDQNIRYKPKSEKTYARSVQPQYPASSPPYGQNAYGQYFELKKSFGEEEQQQQQQQQQQQRKDRREDRYSNTDVNSRLDRLTVSTGGGQNDNSDQAPPSPILESYRGTYQSISPMPSPMMLAKDRQADGESSDPSDLDLRPKRSGSSKSREDKAAKKERNRGGETTRDKGRLPSSFTSIHDPRRPSSISTSMPDIIVATPRTPKRVSFYDPTPDAQKIAEALCSSEGHSPEAEPLVSILPSLSTDDMVALRAEYKNHAKTSGKGINMAKHVKLCVAGNLGKATYATALGRWESEAYWANMWYQSGGSRRELLIESLMGRSNSDVREIKNCFRDKRYGDDLEGCMMAELKADKFRLAIMLALEEDRMPDSGAVDADLVRQDVRDLHRALTASASEGGGAGETAMIHIIVLRSDTHLRAVLRAFEDAYQVNFARQMISRSRNLVGETLAHILNGALNRPMRDALLLHQAMTETAPGRERAELLISRVVRLHWERRHMERVKRVYQERYGLGVGEALRTEVWKAARRSKEGPEWVEFLAGCLAVDLHEDSTGKRADGHDDHENAQGERADTVSKKHSHDHDQHHHHRRGSSGSRTRTRRSSGARASDPEPGLDVDVDPNDGRRRSSGGAREKNPERR